MTRQPVLCPSRPTWRLAAFLLLAALALASAPALAQQEGVTVTATRGNDGDTATVSWTAYEGVGFQYYRVIVCKDSNYNGSSCNGADFVSNPIWNVSNTGPVNVSNLDAEKGYGVILQVWRNGSAFKAHATLPAPELAPPPPATPTGLTAAAGYQSVTLAWADPSDATITRYEYQVNHNDTLTGKFSGWGPWQSISGSGAATTSHVLSGLVNGREYRYHVRAVNAGGASGSAPSASPFYVVAIPLDPPAAPTGLIATAGHNRAVVTWNDPSDASISGYEYAVQQAGNDPGGWTVIHGSHANTTSHIIKGLTNGTAYVIHLRAVNAGGAGASVQADVKTPVIIVQDSNGNGITELSVPEGGEVSYQVKLGSRPPADVTMHVYTTDDRYSIDPDITIKDGALNGTRTMLLFTPETWDTAQTVTLVAAEDDDDVHGVQDVIHDARIGYSPKLNALAVTEIDNDQPAAPTGLTVTAGHNRAVMTWNDPSDSSITGYEYAVQQAGNDPGDWTAIHGSGAGTTFHTITGLTNGTAYVIYLRAVNGAGAGAAAQAGVTLKTPLIITQDSNGNPITALSIPEGGEASYQVKPNTRPQSELYIHITLPDGTHNDPDVTFKGWGSNVTLFFTPESWDTAQTVTLVAAEDSDDVNGVRDVNHATRSGYTTKQTVLTVTEIDNEQPIVTAVRGNGGDTATVSWTAYESAGFEYYRVIVCDDSQYNGQSCNGTVFKSPAIWGADSTGPVTVPGLDASTGYGVILQVWRNGSALKVHATLPAPAADGNRVGASASEAVGVGSAGGGAQRQGGERLDSRFRGSDGIRGGDGISTPAPLPTGHVTNLTSAQSGDSDVDAGQRQAVAFTTGPNPVGYVLKSFTAALRKVSGDADLALTLHATASDSQPAATVLATLAGTDPTSGAYTDVTYACSGSGCRLAPGTTYFVVAEAVGTGAYAWAYVASANLYTETTEPADSGWTLGASHYADDNGAWTSWDDWHHARIDFAAPQSPAVTVGNLDRPVHDDACFPSGDAKCAVGFTTGPNPDGYTLAAVTARFAAAADPDGRLGDLVATLHADHAGVPGALLATLSGSNPRAAGDYTYTCSGLESCVLSPNTTYFVQFTATAGEVLSEAYEWASTLSDHETQSPAGNGWTLANGTDGYGSSWSEYRDVGLLRVRATAR